MKCRIGLVGVVAGVGVMMGVMAGGVSGQEWTRFRGPNGTGVGKAKGLPTQWTWKRFRWTMSLPGSGHGSPVIWGKKLFVTCTDGVSGKQIVVCGDAINGRKLWTREFKSVKHRLHKYNSFASASPAVDGARVYLTFSNKGANVLLALDHDGNEVWRRDFGAFESMHGGGTSPMVHKGVVYLCNDQQGKSSLIAVNAKTGKDVWRVSRKGGGRTAYGTPCVMKMGDGREVLVASSHTGGLTGVDLKTGKVAWQREDLFDKRSVASPIFVGDIVFGSCGSGGGGNYVTALKVGGGGVKLLYKVTKRANYVPTPIANGKLVFLFSDNGVVTCLESGNGKVVWQERLAGLNFFGSPVRVGDVLYCISRDGKVVSLRAGRKFEKLGEVDLGEKSFATPAVANNAIYFRTYTKVWCLGGKN